MPSKEWTQHIILRSLTVQKKKDITEKLISNLSEDHFSLETYRIAFRRLYAMYLKKGRLLSWKELIFDSSIPDRNREKLRLREIKRSKIVVTDKSLLLPKSYEEFSALLESNWYNAVHNKTIQLQNKLTTDLSGKQLTNEDINRVYEEIEQSLSGIKKLSSTSGTIFHLSKPTITECLANFRNKLKNNFFIPTGFKEFDDRNLGIPVDSFFLIAGKAGSGKCLEGNSIVPTNKGLLTLEEIWKSQNRYPSTKGFKKVEGMEVIDHKFETSETTKVFRTIGRVDKILTNFGDEIVGLPEHKLLCVKHRSSTMDFIEISDILKKDWVAKSIGTNIFSTEVPSFDYYDSELINTTNNPKLRKDVTLPRKLSIELSEIFGFMVAEGYSTHYFCNTSEEINNYYCDLLLKVFKCERKIYSDNCSVRHGALVGEFIGKYCGSPSSSERFIPLCIRQSPEKFQCAFLRAFFEGDGSVYPKEAPSSIEATTISKQLAYEIKAILENIGIFCSIRKRESWATNGSENQVSKDSYTVKILKQSFILFSEKIGFISIKKNKLMRKGVKYFSTLSSNSQNTNMSATGPVSKMPGMVQFDELIGVLDSICLKLSGSNFPYSRGTDKFNLNMIFGQSDVSLIRKRRRARKVIELTKYTWKKSRKAIKNSPTIILNKIKEHGRAVELIKFLNKCYKHTWSRVVSKDSGIRNSIVYDLTVPGNESYAVNGIMGHNSTLALTIGMNFKRSGARVCFLPLEMGVEMLLIKMAASIIKVPVTTIVKEYDFYHKKVVKAVSRFLVKDENSPECFDFYVPDSNATLEDVLAKLKPNQYDIIIVDYITLLASMDKEDWKSLDKAGRLAKVFATNNKTIVCLLAQLDETTENVRYSRSLTEHCVPLSSYVNINGKLKLVKDIVNEEIREQDYTVKIDTVSGVRKTEKLYYFGEKKVKSITTDKGYNIKTTLKTPLLVLTPEFKLEWRKSSELKVDDRIAVKKGLSFPKKDVIFNYIDNNHYDSRNNVFKLPPKMTPELAKILGYLCAEGSFDGKGIFFGNADKEVCKDFYNAWINVFGNTGVNFSEEMQSRQYVFRTISQQLYRFLTYIGVPNTSRNMEIPKCILESTKECAIEFLKAYMEGDGYSSKSSSTIGCTTYSRKLANQLQLIFLKFGIIAARNMHKDTYDRKKDLSNKYWQLNVCGSSCNKYMNQIGFITKKKNSNVPISYKSDTEGIPYLLKVLNNKKKGRNKIYCEDRKSRMVRLSSLLHTGVHSSNTINPNKINEEFLTNLKTYFPTLSTVLQTYLDNDLFFDKIVKIKEGKAKVADFTVKEGNTGTIIDEGNFIANGLVTHNSSNAFIWPEDHFKIKETGYMTIKQKKARNQDPFTFRLAVDLATSSITDYVNTGEERVTIKAAEGFDDIVPKDDDL